NHAAVERALDGMIKDEDSDVRAAAATAAGKLGRTYQDRLVKMAKGENYNVRIGAAEGLASTTLSGGNVGVGIDGIAQLWREKGRPRRDAVKIWAHLARKKAFANVIEYLSSAAKIPEDPACIRSRSRACATAPSRATPMRAAPSRARPTIHLQTCAGS